MTKSVLGKGLGSLIPPRSVRDNLEEGELVTTKEPENEIEVAKIQSNPQQPRRNFDQASMQELVDSIKVHGIIQPLVVMPVKGGYHLIAGERRLRAARTLGLKKVPAIIRSVSDQEKLELALVENVQRRDLNPLEKAYGFQRLINEFNLTQEEVGKKVGQSRASVSNALRLLTLPEEMQKALHEEKITEGHAKVLLSVKSEEERRRIFQEILAGHLSVRRTEHQAQKVTVRRHTRRRSGDPNMRAKEEMLQEALGTKVEISKKGEQGAILVHFYSAEELQEIIRKIIK